jgi:ribosome biogenesis GTPase
MAKRRKPPPNDLAARYKAGEFDSDRTDQDDADQRQTFSDRSKHAEADKIAKTTVERGERAALLAAAAEESGQPVEQLPAGQVMQVYSMFSDVESADGKRYLCVVRKTLTRSSDTRAAVIVGDQVRMRDINRLDSAGRSEAVIEHVDPRRTVLTRTDSFKGQLQQPIVANADQMLIVAAVTEPPVKWGLIDRMIVAARSGGLVPIVCLNKVDLVGTVAAGEAVETAADDESLDPVAVLDYYLGLGIQTLRTSVETAVGLDELRAVLAGRTTVLAGHSGVGKSSLIRAIDPALSHIRIGAISGYTGKGRHTTSSARHYPLAGGGAVIDTPGVKLFGLWGVTPDRLIELFPDVQADTAPPWRRLSYERILGTIS